MIIIGYFIKKKFKVCNLKVKDFNDLYKYLWLNFFLK